MAKKKTVKVLPGQLNLPLPHDDVDSPLTIPERFLDTLLPSRTDDVRLALSLDLGTRTGYAAAYFTPGKLVDVMQLRIWAGQLDLSISSYDSRGITGVRLGQFLTAAMPDIIFFEDVRVTPMQGSNRHFASVIAQAASTAEFFGGLKMALSEWSERNNRPTAGIGIADIKRAATGRGNASKEDIIIAYNKLFGQNIDPTAYEKTGADNMCDAVFGLLHGLTNYGAGVT